jgi:hypothetical protein
MTAEEKHWEEGMKTHENVIQTIVSHHPYKSGNILCDALDTGLNERGSRGEKLMNRKRYLLIVGIVVAAVALSMLFYTMLANHRLAITSLEAEPGRVLPSGSCQIACTASDHDGNKLSYNWSADGGEITGEGATVTWTAPNSEGSYNVTVTVTDGHGGEVMNQVAITVSYQSSSPADRVDVVYFHRTQRCHNCIHAEELTRYTVETYFTDDLASGKVTFQSINVQDEENADVVEKYGAYGPQLFINTVKDSTDYIEEATDLYVLISNDKAFVTALKSKIEKSLNGET